MIRTFKHPDYKTLNPQLEKWIRFLPDMDSEEEYSNLNVFKRTSYHSYPRIFTNLAKWVLNTCEFSINSPKFDVDIWGAIYNKGDYASPHGHGEGVISFVYYVNADERSSPLIFSDINEIYSPERGLCVAWNDNEIHEVPPNKCDNRIIIAGNFYHD
jgi:hypothetical protein